MSIGMILFLSSKMDEGTTVQLTLHYNPKRIGLFFSIVISNKENSKRFELHT